MRRTKRFVGLRSLFGRAVGRGRRRRWRDPSLRRATFERLEDRDLLAVLTVNTTLDLVRPGDGLVSLREAIDAANNDTTTDLGQTGSDTDTIDLTSISGTITLTLGELWIHSVTAIVGPGRESLTIDGQGSSRIFRITYAPIVNYEPVTLSGLTLTGGMANGDGGAIMSRYTRLVVEDCAIVGNRATGSGGGIFSEGNYHGWSSSLTLVDSIVSGNMATGRGGGVYTYFDFTTIEGTIITDNSAGGQGGGIWTNHYRGLGLTISSSEIRNNDAGGSGGGIHGGPMSITDSVISGNTTAASNDLSTPIGGSWGGGGGLVIGSQAVLTRTTIVDNTSTNGRGGGILLHGVYGASVELASSTISGNSAAGSGGGIGTAFEDVWVTIIDSLIQGNEAGGSGGGIQTSAVEVRNATISGNSAGGSGGGIDARQLTLMGSTVRDNTSGGSGGGVNAMQIARLENSTISGNQSLGNGGGVAFSSVNTVRYSTVVRNQSVNGLGGGLWSSTTVAAPAAITSSIIAENTAGGGGPDVSVPGIPAVLSYSLIGDNAGTTLLEAQTSDAMGNYIGSSTGGGVIDPRLGPLADHGGPTATHALLPGSPAIDAKPLVVPATPTPVHEYQLNGSLSDARGGPDLVALGGTLTATRYEFGWNQGLNLEAPSINPGEYSIEIVFRWNHLSGARQKMIDFKNLTANEGLYTFGTRLEFFNRAFVPNVIAANANYHLVLTRDNATDIVRVYLNGVERFSFVDTADEAVFTGPSRIIRFFQDDLVTGQLDAESGSVDRIRIYDRVLNTTEIAQLYNPPSPPNYPAFDQRGAPYERLRDGNGQNGAQFDMGAYELQEVFSNTDPIITSADTASVPENSTAVLTVTATDLETPQSVQLAIIGGADQELFSLSPGGALSFLAPPDFEAPGDANSDNVYEVMVRAADGAGGTATQTIRVTVTPLNDNNPVFTSPDSASVAENSTAVLTVTATDADLPGQTVTFSIVGGPDQAAFWITGGGALSFVTAPDYEAPTDANGDNVYLVSIQASDGAGGTTIQMLSVAVMPVNDNSPVFTSPHTVSVVENSIYITTLTATDADLPSEPITFSIVGGADQAQFTITQEGMLSFVSEPDYEAPTDANADNLYVVIVQASDGSRTSLEAVLVFVTDVFEGFAGDYNGDGVVDAGDYVRWRNALAGIGTLENESVSKGVVDLLDYAEWRANYGNRRTPEGLGSGGLSAALTQNKESGDQADTESEVAGLRSGHVLAAPPVAAASRGTTVRGILVPKTATVPHDSALVAWLATRSIGVRREAMGDHDEWPPHEPHDNLESCDSADAMDEAFACLGM